MFGPAPKILENSLATFVWWCGILWLLLAVVGMAVFFGAVWWIAGFWAFLDSIYPFNLNTCVSVMLTLLPGFLLVGWAGSIADRKKGEPS